MKVVITRNAKGLSLNAGIREVLIDNTTAQTLVYENEQAAREYLHELGLTDENLDDWGVAFPSSEFDAYEIHPCEIIGVDSQGKDIVVQCEEDNQNIAFWGLYGHLKTGGLEWISDHASKQDAVTARMELESKGELNV